MEAIDHNLELIRLSRRYEVRKNSDENYYSVYDNESILAAFYDIDDKKWTYGVSDVYDSSIQFVEVPLDDFNNLVKFTRKLSENES